MDPNFLREVQAKGWQVDAVTKTEVICRCPADGCQVRAKLLLGSSIPQARGEDRHILDRAFSGYLEFRQMMRARREGLQLSIRELEEVSGMADDHLAKFESEKSTRTPNLDIAMEWAQALGYELVLRPVGLPRKCLTYISETRDFTERRERRNLVENKRRGAS